MLNFLPVNTTLKNVDTCIQAFDVFSKPIKSDNCFNLVCSGTVVSGYLEPVKPIPLSQHGLDKAHFMPSKKFQLCSCSSHLVKILWKTCAVNRIFLPENLDSAFNWIALLWASTALFLKADILLYSMSNVSHTPPRLPWDYNFSTRAATTGKARIRNRYKKSFSEALG